MDPGTGDVYKLREHLLAGAEVGDRIELETLRARLAAQVEAATSDEIGAAEAEQLVRIGEQAARKLMLGQREQERRRRRRKRRRLE